jgi:hypothetical protein
MLLASDNAPAVTVDAVALLLDILTIGIPLVVRLAVAAVVQIIPPAAIHVIFPVPEEPKAIDLTEELELEKNPVVRVLLFISIVPLVRVNV